MKHEELLNIILAKTQEAIAQNKDTSSLDAVREVIEQHKPITTVYEDMHEETHCSCGQYDIFYLKEIKAPAFFYYPCPTIHSIQNKLINDVQL